jgi:hypothetical protein
VVPPDELDLALAGMRAVCRISPGGSP